MTRPTKQERSFIATVWKFYEISGRHDLPWRKDVRPYAIVVSEIMLQQTQVRRVIPKYNAFLKRWPSARALARAPLQEVLEAWQGLGYNSRAKRLRDCTKRISSLTNGRWPTTYEGLVALPGIGPYTAAAVMNFAYNTPQPLVETNVRTVFIHHFFEGQEQVSDAEIIEVVTKTLPPERPREWFWALMDYGSYLKQTHGNGNSRSAHYKKQTPFKGSNRQIRGAIIRELTKSSLPEPALIKQLSEHTTERVRNQLADLLSEGLVVKQGSLLRIAS